MMKMMKYTVDYYQTPHFKAYQLVHIRNKWMNLRYLCRRRRFRQNFADIFNFISIEIEELLTQNICAPITLFIPCEVAL